MACTYWHVYTEYISIMSVHPHIYKVPEYGQECIVHMGLCHSWKVQYKVHHTYNVLYLHTWPSCRVSSQGVASLKSYMTHNMTGIVYT